MGRNGRFRVAFVASVYDHFIAFHVPFMMLLQQRGYEVHAYARADQTRDTLEGLGFICHNIPIQRRPFHIENKTSLRMLTASFKQQHFQMVHVHTPVASVLGRIAAKRAAVPHVLYTAHGFHFYDGASWRSWLLYYPMERLMARFTDTLITINREDYTRAKRFPVRGQVVHVPGVGLDVGYYQSEHSNNIRQQLGLSTDTFVISCIAELISRKNHRQLLFALKKFTEVNRHVQCLFVGDGEMEQTLKELVNELGLVQFVQFLGSRDDIPHILRATDVCVLLSKQEGLPRVVMEAMAAGLPVIATDIRGNSDLITHGRNGFLVPYGDVAATAVALQKLYKYPELRRRMGRINKKHVMQYDISRIVPQMTQIYLKESDEREQDGPLSAVRETI